MKMVYGLLDEKKPGYRVGKTLFFSNWNFKWKTGYLDKKKITG